MIFSIFSVEYIYSAESTGCFEWHTNFNGYDINGNAADENFSEGSGKRNSKYECQQLCQATPGCAFFTYNPVAQFCYLKTSDVGRSEFRGIVSGPKFSVQIFVNNEELRKKLS